MFNIKFLLSKQFVTKHNNKKIFYKYEHREREEEEKGQKRKNKKLAIYITYIYFIFFKKIKSVIHTLYLFFKKNIDFLIIHLNFDKKVRNKNFRV